MTDGVGEHFRRDLALIHPGESMVGDENFPLGVGMFRGWCHVLAPGVNMGGESKEQASIEKLNARLEQVNARQVKKACISDGNRQSKEQARKKHRMNLTKIEKFGNYGCFSDKGMPSPSWA